MIWTIELIKTTNYIRVILKGDFNVDEHLKMIEDVISLDYWKPGMNVLIDSREVN